MSDEHDGVDGAPPGGAGAERGARDDHAGHRGIGGGPECVLCPICVALQAIGASRPEVLHHLAGAGRELALAVQALLEAVADAPETSTGGGDTGLERIDVE